MGNEVREFDLHIEVGSQWYCGDASITCEVTYPSMGSDQPPINVDYDRGDENLDGAIERAIKDIAAYMQDPEEWVHAYIEHSSEDWRKLKVAQEQVKKYRQRMTQHEKEIEIDSKYLAEYEVRVAMLQRRIGSETSP